METNSEKNSEKFLLEDLEKIAQTQKTTHSETKLSSPLTLTNDVARESIDPALLPSEPERYHLLKTLGEGGMGMVQLVQDSMLQREVALKTIRKKTLGGVFRSRQQVMAWRLKQEAEITAVLEHPNIIPLYDMQRNKEGDLYFTMRKVDGETLSGLLRKKRSRALSLSEEEILKIFSKVCDAVGYAHSRGIIHRDLKPDNIMVGQFGEVYVMDWGIAKQIRSSSETQTSSGPNEFAENVQDTAYTPELSSEGTYKTIGGMGTIGYMPPEQEREASQVTPQADIYALGKILRQCFTLQSPTEELRKLIEFRSKQLEPRGTEAAFEEPKAKIPRDILAIIDKATRPNPEGRYESIRAFLQDIERYSSDKRISAREYGRLELIKKWIKRNQIKVRIGAGFLCVCLLFLFGFWGFLKQQKLQVYHQHLKLSTEEETLTQRFSPQEKGEKLEHLLRALNYMNMALALNIDDLDAERRKLELSEQLVALACETQNYHFASYIAKEVKNLKQVAPNQNLEAHVETEKTKMLKQHQQRLEYWKVALQDPMEGMLEEALLEISKMDESEIFEALIAQVQDGTEYFLKNPERTVKQNEYYSAMAKLLGSLENPKAGDILWKSLQDVSQTVLRFEPGKRPSSDLSYMVVLVEALKNSKIQNCSLALLNLRNQLAESPVFMLGTELFFQKLVLRDQSVTKIQPRSAKEYYERAMIKNKIKDFKGAITDYTLAIQLNSQEAASYFERGNTHMNQGNFEEALSDYTQTITMNPQHFSAYSNRGLIRIEKGDLDGAIDDHSEAIRLNPQYSVPYLNRGHTRYKKGDYPGSIEDCSEAIRLNDEFPNAYRTRGLAKYATGDIEGALEDLSKAIELSPKYAEFYRHRGFAYYQKGDFEKAILDFSESIRLNPQNTHTYNDRGNAKLKKGDLAGAKLDYSEAIRLNPNFAGSHSNRGSVCFQQRDFEQAFLDYSEAIRLDPKIEKNYYSRGVIHQQKEEWEKAIADYSEAIRLNPQDFSSYSNRGSIQLMQGKIEESLKDFEKAYEFADSQSRLQILLAYEHFERVYATISLVTSLKLFQKRQKINGTVKFSQELADAVLNRMAVSYRKKAYTEAQADLELFERYASPAHPKYSQIPQLRASLEKIKPSSKQE